MQPCKACTVPESKFNTLKKHPNKVRMPAYEVWEMQNGTAGETQAANLQDYGERLLGSGDRGSCCRDAGYHRVLTSMTAPR